MRHVTKIYAIIAIAIGPYVLTYPRQAISFFALANGRYAAQPTDTLQNSPVQRDLLKTSCDPDIIRLRQKNPSSNSTRTKGDP
jgi:hypothetical protein